MDNEENELVARAQSFAHDAHDSINQKRKYSGKPYWIHTDEVAEIVSGVTEDPEIIAAAHLHDVLEDVNEEPYDYVYIKDLFGSRVVSLVKELTDEFTKKRYPKLNRTERKSKEAERLSKLSPDAQTIKLADMISNAKDLKKSDPGFADVYLREKETILEGMTKGNPVLFKRAKKIVANP